MVRAILLCSAFASASSVTTTILVPYGPRLLDSSSGDESFFAFGQVDKDFFQLADVGKT
ncbi:hypothetical protein PI125_g23272 [Phytophthora idaei]|nr:hypothetical protein PI125_g23272 [Phytophthora idaei]KAG3128649.1 hypothetical protein PI126_g21312 [Phytophthora idaei]